jgi:hypothetical protein
VALGLRCDEAPDLVPALGAAAAAAQPTLLVLDNAEHLARRRGRLHLARLRSGRWRCGCS